MVGSAPPTGQRILAVAVDLFLAQGFEAISMREVAKRAGITAMAIYRHYPDKNALLDAVLEAGFKRYETYVAIERGPLDAVQHMRARALRIFDFATEQGAYFELMFLSSRAMRAPIGRDRLRAILAPSYRIARNTLRECREGGFIATDDIDAMARTLLSYCIGFCSLRLSGMLAETAERARIQYGEGFDRLLDNYRI